MLWVRLSVRVRITLMDMVELSTPTRPLGGTGRNLRPTSTAGLLLWSSTAMPRKLPDQMSLSLNVSLSPQDGEADFDAFENENVAAEHAGVVARHLELARRQWAK